MEIVFLLLLINAGIFMKDIMMVVVRQMIFAKMFVLMGDHLMETQDFVFAMTLKMLTYNAIRNAEIMLNKFPLKMVYLQSHWQVINMRLI